MAGRVGGYLEARRIHGICLAHGVPVWCGGMLETCIGVEPIPERLSDVTISTEWLTP